MTAKPDNTALDPQQVIAELQRQLDEYRAELTARNSAYSERITYQAAANDVLKVMSASPGDPQPVFDLISVRARDLCDAYGVTVYEFDGSLLHWRAATGVSDDPAVRAAAKAAFPLPPTPDLVVGRAILSRATIHIQDYETEPGLRRFSLAVKSTVAVPLMRGSVPIGALQMGSRERGGFSDAQVGLLETFADQAVIAMENARLFNETQEALERQTATANILKVIASSPTDVQPVMNAIVESACELCGAYDAVALLKDGDDLLFSAHHGPIPMRSHKRSINRNWTAGRAFIEKKAVHVHDLQAEPKGFPEGMEMARDMGHRTIVSVPLLRESESIGALVLRRMEVNPFSEKQIALLQTFADQAVIAIENVRLFDEVQAKTRDLTESLQQQTATSEVLKVISSSPGELQPVFNSMLENAVSICDAKFGNLFLADGDTARWEAGVGTPPKLAEFFTQSTWFRPTPGSHLDRVLRTKQVSQTADDTAEAVIGVSARLGGARSTVCVPMVKDDSLVGAIVIYRTEMRPFTDKQIDLVKNFAAQAVIAIENARLLKELRQRTDDLSASLDNLRAAQDRLVQTEKLASLGQLTAGIAHEIKNPLNFVNNFSALSAELVGELDETLAPAPLDQKMRGDVGELSAMLKANLEKVVQHGKRADSIVKNMLLHSREGSGKQRPADINALLDESLNLAYHGARAEKPGFSITLERDLDPNAGVIELFPQEIARAFLNLISNGFYAASKRKAEHGEAEFEPVLSAATKNLGNSVEIRIRDNGTGIPPEVKEKIFNPFFTTKPAGEGTGLGLSISHDIIVKQHGGRIDVETEPGEFTEFKIVLPRVGTSLNKSGEHS